MGLCRQSDLEEQSQQFYCFIQLSISTVKPSLILQAVVKALENLAEEGKIREKTYGKQKVYVADQVDLRSEL